MAWVKIMKKESGKAPLKTKNRFLQLSIEVVQALFPVLLITFALLILLETFFKGCVSSYLDLDQLVRAVVVVSFIAVLSTPDTTGKRQEKSSFAGKLYPAAGIAVAVAAIVWYKTQALGWLAYLVSALSGLLAAFIFAYGQRGEGEGNNGNDTQNN